MFLHETHKPGLRSQHFRRTNTCSQNAVPKGPGTNRLTLPEQAAKSNGKVRLNPFDSKLLGIFAPACDCVQDAPPFLREKWLQQIWASQRLKRDRLSTLDGQPIRVLHPGFWNHGPGPDFKNAIVKRGAAPAQTGDVEVDIQVAGWQHHGHNVNPRFRGVILHVVYEAAASDRVGSPLPTLELKPWLDAPLAELQTWIEHQLESPAALKGKCCEPLAQLPGAAAEQLIESAALLRLKRKAHRFLARAREAGWEQALWEGLFAALGYHQNPWPMQQIAEHLPSLIQDCNRFEAIDLTLEARLMGVAGFLHQEPARTLELQGSRWRALWDCWWRDRDAFSELVLPRETWVWASTRPSNHPQRRLAAAAVWLKTPGWIKQLESWVTTPQKSPAMSLLRLMQPSIPDFWKTHWHLGKQVSGALELGLLGPPRVSDIAMNALLPWAWAKAAVARSESVQKTIEERYLAWPTAQENAVLRLARERLFGAVRTTVCTGAAGQQGLLQVATDYCQRSNALCQRCRFPAVVDAFSKTGASGAGATDSGTTST